MILVSYNLFEKWEDAQLKKSGCSIWSPPLSSNHSTPPWKGGSKRGFRAAGPASLELYHPAAVLAVETITSVYLKPAFRAEFAWLRRAEIKQHACSACFFFFLKPHLANLNPTETQQAAPVSQFCQAVGRKMGRSILKWLWLAFKSLLLITLYYKTVKWKVIQGKYAHMHYHFKKNLPVATVCLY